MVCVDSNDVRGPPKRMHFHVHTWVPALFNCVGDASIYILNRWLTQARDAPWYREWCWDQEISENARVK